MGTQSEPIFAEQNRRVTVYIILYSRFEKQSFPQGSKTTGILTCPKKFPSPELVLRQLRVRFEEIDVELVVDRRLVVVVPHAPAPARRS